MNKYNIKELREKLERCKNISLDEMMDKTPRSSSTNNTVDLTSGFIPQEKEKTIKEEQVEKHIEVTVAETGPVNMSEMNPIDATSILPKRKVKNEML